MLLLAGVAISTLTGQGSIIENAKNAVGKYNNSVMKEQELLNLISSYFEKTPKNGEIVVLERKESEISVKVEGADFESYQFSLDGINWSEEQTSSEYTFTGLEKVYVDGRSYTWDEEIEIKTGNKYTVYAKGKDSEGNTIELKPVETSNIVEVRELGADGGEPDWIQYEELENEVMVTGMDAYTHIENINATDDNDLFIYPGYHLIDNGIVDITIPSYINGKPVTKISQKVIESIVEPKINSGVFIIYMRDEGFHILGSARMDFKSLRYNKEDEGGGKGLQYAKGMKFSEDRYYNILILGDNWFCRERVFIPDANYDEGENFILNVDAQMFKYNIILPPTLKEIVPYKDIEYEIVNSESPEMVTVAVNIPNITAEWREGNIKILGKESLDEIINGDILKNYQSIDYKFYN